MPLAFETRDDFIDLSLQGKMYLDGDALVILVNAKRDPDVTSKVSYLQRMGKARSVRYVKQSEFSQRSSPAGRRKKGNLLGDSVTVASVHKLLDAARQRRATDIHIQVFHTKNLTNVLMRIHGSLVKTDIEMNSKQGQELCRTIYGVVSDAADATYVPSEYQDARIANVDILPKGIHAVRVAAHPHDQGWELCLRLLGETGEPITGSFPERMSALGFSPSHVLALEHMRAKPTGIIFLSGPTGSGKSTTLQHVLECQRVDRPHKRMLTIEDPPEYRISGAIQLEVLKPTADPEGRAKGFSSAISHVMRCDPDILMVGEVRDAVTADMVLAAAQTGHQVWTTVHANSAWNIIHRLNHLLKSEANTMDLLTDHSVMAGLVSQRLVKVLCPHCKIPFCDNIAHEDPAMVQRLRVVLGDDFSHLDLASRGQGCEHCMKTGYSGRTLVAEVVNIDPYMLRLLRDHGVAEAEEYWRVEQAGTKGKRSLVAHAIEKVKAGLVSPALAEDVVGPLDQDVILADGKIEESELASYGAVPSGARQEAGSEA